MFLAAPLLYETPLSHGTVFMTIFVGGMYATALVQHWLHWRRSRRGFIGGAPDADSSAAPERQSLEPSRAAMLPP
jgi:hypothetical protein